MYEEPKGELFKAQKNFLIEAPNSKLKLVLKVYAKEDDRCDYSVVNGKNTIHLYPNLWREYRESLSEKIIDTLQEFVQYDLLEDIYHYSTPDDFLVESVTGVPQEDRSLEKRES